MAQNTRILFVGGLLVALSAGGGALAQEGQFVFAFRAAPELPAPDVGPRQNAHDCDENDGPRWPAGSDALADVPGIVAKAAFYCTLEQLDPCVQPNPTSPLTCESGTPGAQGWMMSFTASGCDALIVDVTATQTDIAPGTIEDCERGPGGTDGFDNTVITTGLGNEGAVHVINLHLKKATTLDPTRLNTEPATGPEENPANVCRFLVKYTIPATTGDSCDLTLSFVPGGLDWPGGRPESPFVIQNQNQSILAQLVEKTVTVTAVSRQLPGDCNQDGSFDLSDIFHFLDFLFKGESLPCFTSGANLALMDCNGDGALDLSDVIYKLPYLFGGGSPPVQGSGCIGIADCPQNPGCP